jgi:hypothetical protein
VPPATAHGGHGVGSPYRGRARRARHAGTSGGRRAGASGPASAGGLEVERAAR